MSFAKRLKKAREAAGVTQVEIAEICGLSKGAVSAWETGAADGILAANLFPVADLLGVDPRWLATGHGSPSTNAVSAAIIPKFMDLTDEQKDAVRALVASIARSR